MFADPPRLTAMTAPVVRGPRGQYAKSRARQAEIVDAAISVFAAHGYHGGSLREIARAADLSLTALTHHFPTKPALLEAVLDETDRQGSDIDMSDGLVAWILRLAERNLGRPELLRVLAIVSAEASSPEHPVHPWAVARYVRLRRIFSENIVADHAAGRLAAVADPHATADAIIALWDGLQLQWLIDPSIDMIDGLRSALASLLPPANA